MDSYINHIENELSGEKDDKSLYEFKKSILNDMNARANEITHTGLKDEKVLSDLVISEFADIKGEYKKQLAKNAAKKRSARSTINNIVGSAIFLLTGLILFLCVGFMTKSWGTAWIILDATASILIMFQLFIMINRAAKSNKKLFRQSARIMLGINVMIFIQLLFFICLLIFDIPKSWILFIFGVILMFIADSIYISATKQRLRILSHLFYILAASPLIYVIFALLDLVTWSRGWLIILVALLLDFVIIAIKLLTRKNSISYEEVE